VVFVVKKLDENQQFFTKNKHVRSLGMTGLSIET